MGRAPALVYAPEQREIDHLSEARLREALTVRQRRRVHRDTTVSVHGQLFEMDHGYLARQEVRAPRLTYCRNATLGRRAFYRYLCHALGLQASSTAASLSLPAHPRPPPLPDPAGHRGRHRRVSLLPPPPLRRRPRAVLPRVRRRSPRARLRLAPWVDRLAAAALRDAARRKRKLVDRDIVVHVAEALTCPTS
jgi:hypothetical protein